MKKFSATFWILTVNVLFFLIVYPLAVFYNETIFSYVAIAPSDFVNGIHPWTIITSMFMHGSVSHLLMNMLSLIFLGGFLEKLIGRKRFVNIYFVSGIIASLFFVAMTYLFSPSDINVSAVGASGAIFGLAGMLAILTPKLPVYLFFIPIAMPMWLGAILILILMWLVSAAFNVPIGNLAHLGGLLTGIAYAVYLKNKYKHKAKIIAEYYS